jgi:hypothetical protein
VGNVRLTILAHHCAVTIETRPDTLAPMVMEILFSLLLAVQLMAVGAGVVLALAVRTIAERARLHPRIETGAPMRWCISPASAPRLHRRLRDSLVPIDGVVPIDPARVPSLSDLVESVVREAVGIDRRIVALHRQPRAARRAALRGLRHEVHQFEHTTRRLRNEQVRAERGAPVDPRWANHRSRPTGSAVLDAVHERLDLLTQAQIEVHALERASTITDPEEILRQIAPPPAVAVEAGGSGRRAGEHHPASASVRPAS